MLRNVYDSGDEFIDDIRNGWNKRVKSIRTWGFIIAILMIVLGVLCTIKPLQTTYALEVVVSAALVIFGIWGIVHYIKLPVMLRSGVTLASSVLNIILGITLLTSPADDVLSSFGFLFGLSMMMSGFEEITQAGALHTFGIIDTGWMTFNGVLNIICGIVLLGAPMASVFAVSFIIAFYLLVGGITLLVACIKSKNLEDESI
ncbi:MAG: DUF308 domain-containing protein [Erysipelotrichaceae bacterium]|nr:DUF308 domain-containing protein [Erysipelotrichaceae bacterium]